jgi:hypothetical protein
MSGDLPARPGGAASSASTYARSGQATSQPKAKEEM